MQFFVWVVYRAIKPIASSISNYIGENHKLNMPTFAVTDNGTNVIKSCRRLNIPRLPCFAHIMNLCLDPVIFPKEPDAIFVSSVIDKVRNIATLFKRSPKLWNDFKAIYKSEINTSNNPIKIPRDSKTRWNSSLPMINEAISQAE